MKKGLKMGLKTGIVVIILLIVAFGIYYSVNHSVPLINTCGKIGEQTSTVYKEYPAECCEGLTAWASGMDTSISVAEKCYDTNLMAGSPINTCIPCGNGVCDSMESVCNCPADCKDNTNSDYPSLFEFCTTGYKQYCNNPQALESYLCKIC
jgi:hypothetical protein